MLPVTTEIGGRCISTTLYPPHPDCPLPSVHIWSVMMRHIVASDTQINLVFISAARCVVFAASCRDAVRTRGAVALRCGAGSVANEAHLKLSLDNLSASF